MHLVGNQWARVQIKIKISIVIELWLFVKNLLKREIAQINSLLSHTYIDTYTFHHACHADIQTHLSRRNLFTICAFSVPYTSQIEINRD